MDHQVKGIDGNLTYLLELPAHGEATLRCLILGENHAGVSAARQRFGPILSRAASLLQEKQTLYRDRLLGGVRFTCSDPAMNHSFVFAKANVMMSTMDLRPGYPAPFLAGFPIYTWLFGCDSLLSTTGVTSAGFEPEARDTLLCLLHFAALKKQGAHEVASNGRLLGWDHIQESPRLVLGCWEHFLWSRDFGFLKQAYPICQEMIAHILATADQDHDGYLEGPALMEQAGMGSERLDSVCYLYAVYEDLDGMAETLGVAAFGNYRLRARELKTRFNRDWWNPKENMWACSLRTDHTQTMDHFWAVVFPQRVGIADLDKATSALNRIQNEWVNDQWGFVAQWKPKIAGEGVERYQPGPMCFQHPGYVVSVSRFRWRTRWLCVMTALMAWIGIVGVFNARAQAPGNRIWTYEAHLLPLYSGNSAAQTPAVGPDGTIYFSDLNRLHAVDGWTGTVLWRFEAFAGPPVVGPEGTIYGSLLDGRIVAVDGRSGRIRWTTETRRGPFSPAAIGNDGTLYLGSVDHHFYALDAGTGTQRWSMDAGSLMEAPASLGFDGTVYVGSMAGTLFALDPRTGAQRWTYGASGSIGTCPPVVGARDTLFLGSGEGRLHAVDSVTGARRWTFFQKKWTAGCTPSLGADGTVYVGGSEERLNALDPVTGQVKWFAATQGRCCVAPLVGADGVVYAATDAGYLYAFQVANGVLIWKRFEAGKLTAPVLGPEGRLLLGVGSDLVAIACTSREPAASPWPGVGQNRQGNGNVVPAFPPADPADRFQLGTQGGAGAAQGELAADLAALPDGGWLLAATSSSGVSAEKSAPGRGGEDFWLVRLDARFSRVWDASFGGSAGDFVAAVEATADGGAVVVGTSASNTSVAKSSSGRGGTDLWVVRAGPAGERLWDAALGGSGRDWGTCLARLADGRILVGGYSDSSPNAGAGWKTAPARGLYDFYVVCLDADGHPLWDATYGGDQNDQLREITVLRDGTILLTGESASGVTGTKTSPNFGRSDLWVVAIDDQGRQLWDRTYGGLGYNGIQRGGVVSEPDGGFTLCGYTATPGEFATVGYFIRCGPDGMPLWTRRLSHALNVLPVSLVHSRPDRYTVLAQSNLNLDPTGGPAATLLWELDAQGNVLAERILAGKAAGRAVDNIPARLLRRGPTDFVAAVSSYASADGLRTFPNRGDADAWVFGINLGPQVPSLDLLPGPRLQFHIGVGMSYRLQRSPDLRTWTDDGEPTVSAALGTERPVTLSEDARFWRLVPEQ